MPFSIHPSTLVIILHGTIMVGTTVRVIMKRPQTGVALAWLFLVALVPFGGAAIYFMIGERRIGRTRTQRLGELRARFAPVAQAAVREGLTNVDWTQYSPAAHGMDRLGATWSAVGRYTAVILSCIRTRIRSCAIAQDVDAAQTSVLMEFYIWNAGGDADAVLEAVIRAAERGVTCRLLIDALGARPWWKTDQPRQLRGRRRPASRAARRTAPHVGGAYRSALTPQDRGGRR